MPRQLTPIILACVTSDRTWCTHTHARTAHAPSVFRALTAYRPGAHVLVLIHARRQLILEAEGHLLQHVRGAADGVVGAATDDAVRIAHVA